MLQSQEESLEAPTKSVSYVDGIPHIQWTASEVEQMNIKEDLQYAVVGKFAHGWPEMDDLRDAIPKQCNIKSKCKIGLFRNRHILIRLYLKEDYINLISKGAFYITCKEGYSYIMRTLIYDVNFKIDEETTKTMAWISFPNLLPTFFWQR